MGSNELKIIINKDINYIIAILKSVGIKHNWTKGKVSSFFFDDDRDSSGSFHYSQDSMSWIRYSTNETGDIFKAIILKKRCNLIEAKQHCEDVLFGKEVLFTNVTPVPIKKRDTTKEILVDFDKYKPCISTKYYKDGIGILAQHIYDIRATPDERYICIGWKNDSGNVIGVIGRNNETICDKRNRFIALEEFTKSNYLFGLYENIFDIQKLKSVYIFESEKSVMQCYTFGVRNTVALGGSHLSERQIQLLKNIGTLKNIIFCFDEGLDALSVLKDKLPNLKKNFDVFLYTDVNNVRELGGKQSPSDLGKEGFSSFVPVRL